MDSNPLFRPRHEIALALLACAATVVFGTGLWWLVKGVSPGYSESGAAAFVAVLLLLATVMEWPTMIADDDPKTGGQPSTMRILVLMIVVTFCVLMIRAGWDQRALPSLENQGNWVWIITAALGGKALQRFAEVKEKESANTRISSAPDAYQRREPEEPLFNQDEVDTELARITKR